MTNFEAFRWKFLSSTNPEIDEEWQITFSTVNYLFKVDIIYIIDDESFSLNNARDIMVA